MTKLRNGSQVTTRPARKITAGTAGYFSESNDSGEPSYPGQDWFNDLIDEIVQAVTAAGVTYDPTKITNLKSTVEALRNASNLNAGTVALARLPVTTNATDGTPDKLLKVGDGGLLSTKGVLLASGDANTLIIAGLYCVPATWTGSPYPGANGANQGVLEHINASPSVTTYAIQRFTRMQNANTFFRFKNNGVWSDWREILHAGNTGNAVGYDVTSSATDTTQGKLLKVGDFGIGGDLPFESFNTPLHRVSRYISDAVPDSPTGLGGWLMVNKTADRINSLSQTLSAEIFVDRNGDRMLFRHQNSAQSTVLSAPWREVYHSANLAKAAVSAVVAGTNDTTYITPKSLHDANILFGVGQTRQQAELTDTGATFDDGTPSFRAVGTTYINMTDAAIEWRLVFFNRLTIRVGQLAPQSVSDQGDVTAWSSISVCILPGEEYEVVAAPDGIRSWSYIR
ncbi:MULTISPECIES: pyocin knob domain-containing protein [Marinomonas]|uniref:Pyocin knob domain-containing protein n=1 Tax=Marinomonas rhodophyticola TaxID=2992803 RepID=A0ABT3KCM8_9GAMM|nr:pyocin knob domain-containing protein [Marinomonas sp. KJ51-3]MCW4628293.1 pyocin knob domain-containing protein [Marinomonas sp. KJ51-3]